MKVGMIATMILISGTLFADTGKGCFPQPNYSCLNMPGLSEGQNVTLNVDIPIDHNGWVYFTEGNQIASKDLVKNIGQTYCAVAATENTISAANHRIQKGQYTLSEISWYVNTVFFKAGPAGFVVSCSTVNEQFNNVGVTSIKAIAKDLKGILK